MAGKLSVLVIKPTLKCTAKCRDCSLRRMLHRDAKSSVWLSLSDWKRVLRDAASLGTKWLVISGGEPTLYQDLLELTSVASRLGLHVKINSNGSRISDNLARELLRVGLNAFCASIYSHEPEIHNRIRGNPTLWSSACRAMEIFRSLKSEFPGFTLQSQSVILRENYHSLDTLLKFHYELGSENVLLSYLEGDFSGESLLNEEQIREFREVVLPKIRDFCSTLPRAARQRAMAEAERLYHPSCCEPAQFARGVYGNGASCSIPQHQALVLATGDVHPCNIVEYLHRPVMGNLFQNTLSEIWRSSDWEEFRSNRLKECKFCPMNIHVSIPLRKRDLITMLTDRAMRASRGLMARLFHAR